MQMQTDEIVLVLVLELERKTLDKGKMCNSKCNSSRCDVGYGLLALGLAFGWKIEIAIRKIGQRRRPPGRGRGEPFLLRGWSGWLALEGERSSREWLLWLLALLGPTAQHRTVCEQEEEEAGQKRDGVQEQEEGEDVKGRDSREGRGGVEDVDLASLAVVEVDNSQGGIRWAPRGRKHEPRGPERPQRLERISVRGKQNIQGKSRGARNAPTWR
ncbi:hypothetical protein ACEPPN_018112 [Leptodophora sp. 'Broadleaf-Isolate-01']